MDRISVYYIRTAILWLVVGFALGALMLSDTLLAGDWRAWFAPTHGHVLFVGWFLQFAVGVAYWLLPRKRSDKRPLGYDTRVASAGYLILNAGLVLRVIAEPASHIDGESNMEARLLALSAALQLVSIGIIARQIWTRVLPRTPRAVVPPPSK
jgi:hypothetical protein